MTVCAKKDMVLFDHIQGNISEATVTQNPPVSWAYLPSVALHRGAPMETL